MAENSHTRSSLSGGNELQQLSNKWRNKNSTHSAKLGLILIELGQLGTKRNADLEEYLPLEPYQVLYQFHGELQRFDGERYRILFT